MILKDVWQHLGWHPGTQGLVIQLYPALRLYADMRIHRVAKALEWRVYICIPATRVLQKAPPPRVRVNIPISRSILEEIALEKPAFQL